MNWEGYSEDLKSFEYHSVVEFNLKWTTVQAECGKTCGEKGYKPIAESYNHEFLEVSVRAQSVLLCEPTSIRARVYILSLHSLGWNLHWHKIGRVFKEEGEITLRRIFSASYEEFAG